MVRRDWYSILFIFFCLVVSVKGQERPVQCIDPKFEQLVDDYLDYAIPTISVADAYSQKETYTFLDARELSEFNTSHIPGAIFIGYDNFDLDAFVLNFKKDEAYIVYCSIGYRSEKIGKKLKNKGFTNVQNLYGSIFEWVNQHRPIEDDKGNITTKLHTYNKKWGKWVIAEDIEKIW